MVDMVSAVVVSPATFVLAPADLANNGTAASMTLKLIDTPATEANRTSSGRVTSAGRPAPAARNLFDALSRDQRPALVLSSGPTSWNPAAVFQVERAPR